MAENESLPTNEGITEISLFNNLVRQRHRRINPCFMTGKGCVHTEHIDREWEERTKIKDDVVGFMVRPFRPNIEAFFELCLERYLTANYSFNNQKMKLEQADKIRRTGYVVCEKICRRVQTVDYLVVDVSAPNANVFYELGLAYGIEQKILVIHQESSEFGKIISKYLQNDGCRVYQYKDLNPIAPNDFMLSKYLWHKRNSVDAKSNIEPTILLISNQYGFLSDALSKMEKDQKKEPNEGKADSHLSLIERLLGASDIKINFETHMKAAIGVAIANIVKKLENKEIKPIPDPYLELIRGLRSPDEVKKDAGFNEVRQQVDKAYCTLIHTGGEASEPMSYFWLGYCHANGKNVIPVTMVNEPNDKIDDLAFDIRALWHMTFLKSNPTRFAEELQDTLQQMIVNDFSEWSRKSFWDKMLDRRGRVSIFTGALHNDPIGRDMIGDWDLRAASELTSFFASHQYRATIESPVYQIEQVIKKGAQKEDDYIKALEDMLKGKNCIIIASPDVNPLTEIILGKLYEIPKEKWFSGVDIENETGVVVSFKEADKKSNQEEISQNQDGERNPSRTFYRQTIRLEAEKENSINQIEFPRFDRDILSKITDNKEKDFISGIFQKNEKKLLWTIKKEIPEDDKKKITEIFNKIGFNRLKRGFRGHGVPGSLFGEFLSQKDENNPFRVHAHLVIAKNPFDSEGSEKHHIIVLNGVSGPATFALTHVLTGGTSIQFVAYSKDFNPDAKSEKFLQQVNQDIDTIHKENIRGFQYFLEVEVGPPNEGKNLIERDIFDWRRILAWKRIDETPRQIYQKGI